MPRKRAAQAAGPQVPHDRCLAARRTARHAAAPPARAVEWHHLPRERLAAARSGAGRWLSRGLRAGRECAVRDLRRVGAPLEQEGVINYPVKELFLCTGVTAAKYTTTTEVYPDSPKATPEICIQAQIAAIRGALDYLASQSH